MEEHDETEVPTEAGWFVITREDGSKCVRAYGAGMWWIPLIDGWLSGIPPGFKWSGPVAPMVEGSTRSPFEECKEVAARIGVEP